MIGRVENLLPHFGNLPKHPIDNLERDLVIHAVTALQVFEQANSGPHAHHLVALGTVADVFLVGHFCQNNISLVNHQQRGYYGA